MDMSPKLRLFIRILVVVPAAVAWVMVLVFGSALSQPEQRSPENLVWFAASICLAVVFSRIAAGPRSKYPKRRICAPPNPALQLPGHSTVQSTYGTVLHRTRRSEPPGQRASS
jgi:hypothetical protein